jgi:hypothetical protein
MERLAHGGFLAQCQQAGPERRSGCDQCSAERVQDFEEGRHVAILASLRT